jgi:hypothetical protein
MQKSPGETEDDIVERIDAHPSPGPLLIECRDMIVHLRMELALAMRDVNTTKLQLKAHLAGH